MTLTNLIAAWTHKTRLENIPAVVVAKARKSILDTIGVSLAATVTDAGEAVQRQMVKAGLAEVYRGTLPRGFDSAQYVKVEALARKAKKGMWSLGATYMSSGEWRRIHTRN